VNLPPQRSLSRIWGFGLLAFLLLTVRFAPNWLEFYRGFQTATAEARTSLDRTLVRTFFENTLSTARGVQVVKQVADPTAPVDDLNHKIVRWRLLFPALGHFFGLPAWLVLGFAHIGCLVLVVGLFALGARESPDTPRVPVDALSLAIVAGASAPFFTSMGWLGYYDAWLAMALLVVAFTRTRWLITVTCVLAPWMDERFVLGLPLAMCVRWAQVEPYRASLPVWFKREALLPLLLVSGFAIVRLGLGGSGGSQTVSGYLSHFVLGREFRLPRMLFGAWEGLRFGWLLVFFVAWASLGIFSTKRTSNLRLSVLTALAACSAVFGLFAALDLSRSMILVLPVVPFGWLRARETTGWTKYRVAPILAAAALLWPTHHVVSRFVIPVDHPWSGPYSLGEALNNIGVAYAEGKGVPRDYGEALKWYRLAANRKFSRAQANLGLMYENGRGVPQDLAEALRWYRIAVRNDDAVAQNNLGAMYSEGKGVPADEREAARWFRLAARQGLAGAESNLGALYGLGRGVPRDPVEAVKWFRRAAEQGDATAQVNLGMMYRKGEGVPKDPTTAVHWYRKAAEQGNAQGQTNLGVMYANGDGTAANEIDALAWFYLAERAGDPSGAPRRELMENRIGPEKSLAARRRAEELGRQISGPASHR
jgi:TPR repeat protein